MNEGAGESLQGDGPVKGHHRLDGILAGRGMGGGHPGRAHCLGKDLEMRKSVPFVV